MRTTLFRGLITFVILLVATSLMMDVFKTQFGEVNFFEKRGVFFLIFIALFPRLTLLLSSVVSGGVMWWLGFFLCPRLLVAILATHAYFHTNPILVTMSWLVALGGETAEKLGLSKPRSKFIFRSYQMNSGPRYQGPGSEGSKLKSDDAIEAEFRKD